jgi:hypothetical protein
LITAGNRIKTLKFDDVELDKQDIVTVNAEVNKPNETNTEKANSDHEDKVDNNSDNHTDDDDDDAIMHLVYLDIQDNPVNSLEGFRAINKYLQYLDIRY